jgi:hypothetical protein
VDTSAIRAAYVRGELAAAPFACSDGGSGVDACDGPASVDTAVAGEHELTIVAHDRAGNRRVARVPYTVTAPSVQPAAKTPSTVSIASAKLSARGKTLTLKLRGTATGSGAVKLTVSAVKGSGRSATAPLNRNAFKATLRVRVKGKLPKRIVVTAAYAGDATHLPSSAKRTVTRR